MDYTLKDKLNDKMVDMKLKIKGLKAQIVKNKGIEENKKLQSEIEDIKKQYSRAKKQKEQMIVQEKENVKKRLEKPLDISEMLGSEYEIKGANLSRKNAIKKSLPEIAFENQFDLTNVIIPKEDVFRFSNESLTRGLSDITLVGPSNNLDGSTLLGNVSNTYVNKQ